LTRPAEPAKLARTFRALRTYNYRLFWFGQTVSQTGTWMQNTALAWLVLRLTNSPLALGTVTTAQFAPILLFSLYGGVLADRVPKRRLLLITQSIMLAQALVLATLTATGSIRLLEIYLLAAVGGIANAIDNPARQAFVFEMVGKDDLPNAIALNSTGFQLARLLGAALGGLAIGTIGIADTFYLNAASFLAVIGGLLLMRPSRFFSVPRPVHGKLFKQIGEGLRYAVTTPDTALVVLTMGVLGTFGYNFSVFLPLIARFVLHAGAVGFGILSSSLAAGSVVATLFVAYIGTANRRTLLAGAGAFSLLLFGVALSHWWPVSIVLLLALGFASSVFTATSNARLQIVTPQQLRGRVMSIYTLLFLGSAPIGSLIAGTLAEHGGVQPAIAEMAAVYTLGVLAALLYVRYTRGRMLPDTGSSVMAAEPPGLGAEQESLALAQSNLR